MSVRAELVNALAKGLLGPSGGADERLPWNRNPRDEYIVGVLAPRLDPLAQEPEREFEIEAEVEEFEGGPEGEEDEESGPGAGGHPGFSPSLEPKAQPNSIGLTFVVRSPSVPRLKVCCTFGRYFEDDQEWKRTPFPFISGWLQATDGLRIELPGEGLLLCRSTPVAAGQQRISLFLVNLSPPAKEGGFPATEDFIFQPQIRVLLDEDCELTDVKASGFSIHGDEGSLNLLYAGKPVLARGHMCAATWRSIDPERDFGQKTSADAMWADGHFLTESDRAAFRCPHVRTVFLPAYSVKSPEMEWQADYGPPPVLDAAILSESNSSAAITAALEPLLVGYRAWIKEQANVDVSSELAEAKVQHLAACYSAADRISQTIIRLAKDDELRLAFCWANRAIALQYEWKGKRFMWRPFQLAFLLLTIESSVDGNHPDRSFCDLLWFPTGGGKTEAYLGLVAFVLGMRRLRATQQSGGFGVADGLAVISRYTLRLLTIQQFRRALAVITACEVLRTLRSESGNIGWRPSGTFRNDDWIWGTGRFSAGIWVGGGVTPNHMKTIGRPPHLITGALDLLAGQAGASEPAQVLNCPCCGTHLAIAQPRYERQEKAAFPPGAQASLSFVFFAEKDPGNPNSQSLCDATIRVLDSKITPLPVQGFYALSIRFESQGEGVSAREVDSWWNSTAKAALGGPFVEIASFRASRPGYFPRTYQGQRGGDVTSDFEVFCPSPECGLSTQSWRETVPVPIQLTLAGAADGWQEIPQPFQSKDGPTTSWKVPIPAATVDDQIYSRPPSLLVGTVDKFARLSFEPRAGTIFGNVTHYHARSGYYREGCPLNASTSNPDHPTLATLSRPVSRFRVPDLILQDELHLIDGPLGSMVGVYESAVDTLCTDHQGTIPFSPKYVASTATVRQAADQVQALFARQLAQFPPPGLSADSSFFAVTGEAHPDDSGPSGRLYIGICTPGKGAQTPIIRVWSILLQTIEDLRARGIQANECDPFWTLVGYFNAVRELAGAAGLCRQDIPQRMEHVAGGHARALHDPVELSSRADSLQLPALLNKLEVSLPSDAEDVVLATSMFGTGVDISRLGLIFVNGQPKTSSSYIQATGRIGRNAGGLVLTFFRASRPRDLDHYEFFTGYHRQLYRSVEPVTVFPFSPRARERAFGPLAVALLRQADQIGTVPVDGRWRREVGALLMASPSTVREVIPLVQVFSDRAGAQPPNRRPATGTVSREMLSELDVWHALVRRHPGQNGLAYQEYSMSSPPTRPVVLGDAQHQQRGLDVAFEDAPSSLRDVEATTGFQV